MAQALILRSRGAITDRTGLEKFPDIDSNLLIDINPDMIYGYSSGSRVIWFQAQGDGTDRDKLFDQVYKAGWLKPQWYSGVKDGHASLRFDGLSTIQNTASGDLPPSRDQPMTMVWVGRVTATPPAGGLARVFSRTYAGSGTGFVAAYLDPDGSLGLISEPIGGGGYVYNDSAAPSTLSQWRCGIAVFNGANSFLSVNGVTQRVATANGKWEGVALGVRTSTASPGDGMTGDTLRQKFFARAFTESEIREMWLSMQSEYGL